MEKLEECTGVLIVTSFIDEAKKIAERINRGSETSKAIDFHSESEYWTKVDEIKNYQVLVITHNLFIGANDRKHNNIGADRGKLDKLYEYKNGKRKLIVIDENIKTIQSVNLVDSDIHSLRVLLSGYKSHRSSDKSLHQNIQTELDALDRMMDFFDIVNGTLGGKSETLVDKYMLSNYMEGCDMSFNTIQDLSSNGKLIKFNSKVLTPDVKKRVTETLASIKTIMNANWLYYTQADNALRTARDATPKEVTTVILDATSTVDYSYRIHPNIDFSIANIIPRKHVRNYQSVNLFLSKEQKTGRTQLIRQGNVNQYIEKIWEEVCSYFNDEEVAIFTFKEIEEGLVKHIKKEGVSNIKLGHFGGLTGKNDYQDCTKIFVIGTPFKPEFVTTNAHALSTRGSVECFSDDKQVREERLMLKYTEIAAELIQALNRSASRSTIDEYGNCPKVNVYMLTPENQNLDAVIVNSIKDNMPGVNIDKWDFTLTNTNKRGPKGGHDDAFIDKMKVLNEDIPFSFISKDLEMTKKQAANFRARLMKAKDYDPVSTSLLQNNITVETKGNKYWLIKH